MTIHPTQSRATEVIAVQPPVITRHFGKEFALVGFQCLGKQAAAIKSMLTQHALTPTVDGRDCGLIHPLRSDIQLARTTRPLLSRCLRQQCS